MSNGTIRRYLIQLLMPNRSSQGSSNPKFPDSQAGQTKYYPIFIENVNEGWHSKEVKHKKFEKRYWIWSLGLSSVVAVAAFIGGALAYSAFIQTRRQADYAFLQNRPWLSLDVNIQDAPINTFNFGQTTNILLKFVFTVNNFGQSPALAIKPALWIEGKISDFGDLGIEPERLCHAVDEHSPIVSATPTFIGINIYQQKEHSIILTQSVSIQRGSPLVSKDKISFFGLACVNYGIPADTSSGYVLQLFKVVSNSQQSDINDRISQNKPILATEFSITEVGFNPLK